MKNDHTRMRHELMRYFRGFGIKEVNRVYGECKKQYKSDMKEANKINKEYEDIKKEYIMERQK